jgi:hypothetical protein
MKNTISITSDCVCTCVDSIADGTNRIFVELNVGDVSAPVLMIWKNGDLQSTIQLYANMLNTVEIQSVFFSAGCTITFSYSHTGYVGKTFTINFPASLQGNLSVKMQSDYVYTAKYTVIGGGGGGGSYILPPATINTLGGIMVGDNLTIEESGRLSATLPPATADSLGGVKVGDGLAIDANGVLYVTMLPGIVHTEMYVGGDIQAFTALSIE